jgi:hypothetical protein
LCAFEPSAKSKLHLAGRTFGKSDAEDLIEPSATAANQHHHPVEQDGRLPSARCRFDDKGGVERLQQLSPNCVVMREMRHE